MQLVLSLGTGCHLPIYIYIYIKHWPPSLCIVCKPNIIWEPSINWVKITLHFLYFLFYPRKRGGRERARDTLHNVLKINRGTGICWHLDILRITVNGGRQGRISWLGWWGQLTHPIDEGMWCSQCRWPIILLMKVCGAHSLSGQLTNHPIDEGMWCTIYLHLVAGSSCYYTPTTHGVDRIASSLLLGHIYGWGHTLTIH